MLYKYGTFDKLANRLMSAPWNVLFIEIDYFYAPLCFTFY